MKLLHWSMNGKNKTNKEDEEKEKEKEKEREREREKEKVMSFERRAAHPRSLKSRF